jgi:hypothetical protein
MEKPSRLSGASVIGLQERGIPLLTIQGRHRRPVHARAPAAHDDLVVNDLHPPTPAKKSRHQLLPREATIGQALVESMARGERQWIGGYLMRALGIRIA